MAHAQWNAKQQSLEERLPLAHAEVMREMKMWQDLREQHLCDLSTKDNMWNDLQEQHRHDLDAKDQKYVSARSDSRKIMREQLDRTLQNEYQLMASINKLTEYTINLEGANQCLKREL